MPRGTPKIGSKNPALSSAAEELLHTPQPVELGVIPTSTTASSATTTSWASEDGTQIDLTEPPPPWETDPRYAKHDTDARRFVTVPANWVLRWINPKLLDQIGWRDWQPVMASDPRVKVLVHTMVTPENNVRRGYQGDILAWMYRGWYESKSRQKAQKARRAMQTGLERQQDVTERIRRGEYGRYVNVDSVTHPTHTIGEGRDMRD